MRWPKMLRKITALRFTRAQRYEHFRFPHSIPTAAGVRVSPDSALENATFWAAHRYLTQTVAQLPKRVMRETARGVSERVFNHPIASLFGWRVNPEMSPFQFVETLTGWAITHGNGIAEIEPDNAGRVAALWPIHPDRVAFCRAFEPMEDARGTSISVDELYYDISNGASAAKTALAARNVFHIRGFGNGPVGLSVVAYAAQSLGWAKATELFGSTFFGESLNPSMTVEVPGVMDQESQDRLGAALDRLYKGPRGKRWAILDGGMKWNKISTQPNDAQFLETMQFQVEQVCRWMGVPPQKVHHLLRMTFNNVEQLSIEVVQDSIVPWAIRWEEEANYKLFGQNRLGFFLKLDLKGLLRGSFKERQEGLQVMRRNGVIDRDEWREIEDLGPTTGGGGNTKIVESNMVPLERVGDQLDAKLLKQQAKQNPAAVPQPANDTAAAVALLQASALLGMPGAAAAAFALDLTIEALESENV